MMETQEVEMSFMIEVAKAAGKKILEVYSQDFEKWEKADESPLTKADILSHSLIQEMLEKKYPHIPILSEESENVTYEKRKNWREFFLIDPLDGTKEFIKKNGEFTVNIALVRDGKPYMGVVHAPVLETTYYGEVGGKSFVEKKSETHQLPLRNFDEKNIRVVASKSHLNDETQVFVDKLKKQYASIEFTSMGSSLKLCLVASGEADVYPRLAPTSEWDTAAAQAIVESSGGDVLIYDDWRPLEYNKPNILNPYFVVRRKEVQL